MSELQHKMEAKGRYQPSKTVEALFTTAVVKIKANAERAVVRSNAVPETEVVSEEDAVGSKAGESIIEQKEESQVETEEATEAGEIETESVEKTDADEAKSETEPVSGKETAETLESEDKQEAETAEDEAEDADGDFEDEAEEKVEMTAEDPEQGTSEVSKGVQQTANSQSNKPNEQLLENSSLCAKDIMQKEVEWVSPEDSVQQAVAKMQQSNCGYLIVGKDGILEGIVSNSDITGALSPYLRPAFAKWRRELDDATLKIRIKWIMSRPAHTVKSEASLVEIVESMCRFGKRAFPVVDEQDKVQGLVTVFDIFRVLSNSTDVSVMDKESESHPFAQFDLGAGKKVKDAK
jgi:CBS domain-containing protein